jgi:hypothetical protein
MTSKTLLTAARGLAIVIALGVGGTAQAGDHHRNTGAQIFQGILQGITNGLVIAQQQQLQRQQQQQQEQYTDNGQGYESYGRARPGGGGPAGPAVSGPQLQNWLAGNSVSGFLSDGTHFCEFYDFNGQVRGVDREYYTGSWSVSGPWLYYDYPGYQDDGAYQVVPQYGSPFVQFYDQNGNQPFYNTQFHGGNVCGV